MVTNDERREVARRLRETGEKLGRSTLLWYHIAKSLGVRTATDGKTACGMLADLIEPPTQCPYYRSDRHHCSAYDDVVDRDALLALADEMENNTWYETGFDHHIAVRFARRIREALGVSE